MKSKHGNYESDTKKENKLFKTEISQA